MGVKELVARRWYKTHKARSPKTAGFALGREGDPLAVPP